MAALATASLLPLAAACGDDATGSGGGDRPTIVVTTTIIGDIVENVVGEQATVEVLLPRGADPHDAAVSVRQADTMARADLLVVNGAGYEQGMADAIAAAEDEGTPVFAFADHVDLLRFGDTHAAEATGTRGGAAAGEDDRGEGGGQGQASGGNAEHGHDEGDLDPHIWTDPARMADAARALGERVARLEGVDPTTVRRLANDHASRLEALDAEIEAILAPIAPQDRVLVTNHEVFGYFADRYGFEIAGAIIPSGTTGAEPSPAALDDLADVIRDRGVPAIFAESSHSTDLAENLAEAVGDVEVVTLFTESLGEEGSGAETYIDLLRTNAERVAGALS